MILFETFSFPKRDCPKFNWNVLKTKIKNDIKHTFKFGHLYITGTKSYLSYLRHYDTRWVGNSILIRPLFEL